jgi:hypothetical protein
VSALWPKQTKIPRNILKALYRCIFSKFMFNLLIKPKTSHLAY